MRANGSDGDGGDITLEGMNITVSGKIDVSGGTGGGEFDGSAYKDSPSGTVDARGRDFGSLGGTVLLDASLNVPGTLTINNNIDAGGGICGIDLGCGSGGTIGLTGCSIVVNAAGLLDATRARGRTDHRSAPASR